MQTRLRELRMKKSISSQGELARQISKKYGYTGEGEIISHGTIAKIEQGNANPYWDVIVILSDFFGVTPEYLMGYDLWRKKQ